jgi:hypothetical protein
MEATNLMPIVKWRKELDDLCSKGKTTAEVIIVVLMTVMMVLVFFTLIMWGMNGFM